MSIAPHLVVIGIGHVGSDVVTNAAALGLFSRISLIDVDKKVRDGQALDNHQATAVAPAMTTTITAANYDACRSADVIIVSAGPSVLPDSYGGGHDSRNSLAQVNSKVIREVMGNICQYTHSAPIILITNPLDVNVHIAATEFDYPTNLVVGTGTALDSARLRRQSRLGASLHVGRARGDSISLPLACLYRWSDPRRGDDRPGAATVVPRPGGQQRRTVGLRYP